MSIISEITQGVKTFNFGGIHPPEYKEYAEDKPIETLPAPKMVHIPLVQHIGAPCEALVKRRDEVKMGQVVGRAEAFVSAPVHASVSGTVKKIDNYPHPMGGKCMTISIENDGRDEWDESIAPDAPMGNLNPAEKKQYLDAIRDAGIVGLGGAAFPTHVKMAPPPEKKIDTLILNGAECEPYLTSDYRTMLERAEETLFGARILMVVLGVKRAVFAIEDNKPKAIDLIRKTIQEEAAGFSALGEIGVAVCKTKYPQGGEKQLILAVLGRQVPSGALPMDVGVVVMNVGTCCATTDAVVRRMPLIERIVTVAGMGIPNPKNLRVRVGTPVGLLLDACGYKPVEGSKLIMGGPMMGKAQRNAEAPVIKGTSGLVVLSPEEVGVFSERPCLRCGRCVQACPMGLMPSRLANFCEHEIIDPLEALGIHDCIECGSCGYICPSQRHLVQWIRMAKMKVREKE